MKNHINEKNELCLSDQAISSKAEYSEAGSPPNCGNGFLGDDFFRGIGGGGGGDGIFRGRGAVRNDSVCVDSSGDESSSVGESGGVDSSRGESGASGSDSYSIGDSSGGESGGVGFSGGESDGSGFGSYSIGGGGGIGSSIFGSVSSISSVMS